MVPPNIRIFVMVEPWLTIIGIGENAPTDLSDASLSLISESEYIFGGKRHLELVNANSKGIVWPVPFSINEVLKKRNKKVVVLASGNPFWFGVGGTISDHVDSSEWICIPSPSTFALAASRLGWRLEEVRCLGLHASPINQLKNIAINGEKLFLLCRDGLAVTELKAWFQKNNFLDSTFWIMESLGGPRERIRKIKINKNFNYKISYPVTVAVEVRGLNSLSTFPGLPDEMFINDGQITKQLVRVITMVRLSPMPQQTLWDIGSGSGAISIEWCRTNRNTRAVAFENNKKRLKNIKQNVVNFGLDHQVQIVETDLPKIPKNLASPDAVFIGGGLSERLLSKIWKIMKPGTKMVVNAVTLESESVLIKWYSVKGGTLSKIEIAQAKELGEKTGWRSNMPLLQWSVTK